jgi:hypothetical protein
MPSDRTPTWTFMDTTASLRAPFDDLTCVIGDVGHTIGAETVAEQLAARYPVHRAHLLALVTTATIVTDEIGAAHRRLD